VSDTSAVTCDDRKQVVLWENIDPPNKPKKTKFTKDHVKKVAYVSVSTVNTVFAASFDGDVTVRNLLAPNANPLLTFTKHYADGTAPDKRPEVWVVTPSPDGTRALSGANNGEIKYWDVASGGENVLVPFKDSDERVAALAFRPAGAPAGKTQFLSGHEDGKALIWQFDNNMPAPAAPIDTLPHGNLDPVNTVAVDKDGKFAVSAGFDRTARVWDLSKPGSAGPKFVVEGIHDDLIWRAAISPNGKKFALASQDGTVRLFDLLTGAEFPGPPMFPGFDQHKDEQWGAMGVDFLSDTRIVYTTADSGLDHIKTWDIPANWP
jgi:WD40 repeat protein